MAARLFIKIIIEEAASFDVARIPKEKFMSFKVGPLSKMKPAASPLVEKPSEEGQGVAMAHFETILAGAQQIAHRSPAPPMSNPKESLALKQEAEQLPRVELQ